MLSTQRVEEIRSRFRIFQRKIFLNRCSQGALSNDVQEGLEEYISTWHEQGSPWELWIERYEQARAAFATFIHANPEEVAIVTSVSAGINGVASALPFRERKKVVMGEFEFPTMGHVWLGQRVRGADVQFVSAEGNSIPVANYEKTIDGKTATKSSSIAIRSSCRSPMCASRMDSVRTSFESRSWHTRRVHSSCSMTIRTVEPVRST